MDEIRKLDANSALMDLDKSLRSAKVGQQCKAIVCFPELFERFPFPILINSAFLKLGDVFRFGNNFLRLCILQVTQQSEMHLDKIFTIEELKDRIYLVIYSNDPYARAITLRMLGSLACILSDDKSVHHSVLQGLDSNDQVEQEASIFATVQFASHSKEFAKGICNKIAAMLEGLSAPLEIKLKLVPVLQHMHYDIQIFTKARSVLKELLPTYPAQEFVLVTLHTLTNLSMRSVVDIPAQISLLLQYIRCDPREAVKLLALQDLNVLAHQTPHLWSNSDCNKLCKAHDIPGIQDNVKSHILTILCTLSSTATVLQLDLTEDCELISLSQRCSNSCNLQQASLGTRLLCLLVTHVTRARLGTQHYRKKLQKISAMALENLLLVLVSGGCSCNEDKNLIRILLPALSEVCLVCETDICNSLVKSIVSLLTTDCDPCDSVSYMLAEALANVLMQVTEKINVNEIALDLYQMLEDIVVMESDNGILEKLIVLLCTLLMVANVSLQDDTLGNKLLLTTNKVQLSRWTLYKVARQAARFGEYPLASKIFSMLSTVVATEHYYFWLYALTEFSKAEEIMLKTFKKPLNRSNIFKNVVKASQHYQLGITSLKCSVSPDHSLHFQCRFARLRCRTLVAHISLLQSCNRLETFPPSATANEARDPTEKSRDLMNWLKRCKEEFSLLADQYGDLHLVSFDADDASLSVVDILQQSCVIMSHLIESVVINRGTISELALLKWCDRPNQEHQKEAKHFVKKLKRSFNAVYSIAEEVIRKDDHTLPLNNMHTECLVTCSAELLKVPLSFPRYFFQSLQTTTIKLAISPSMRSPNDPVSVNINQRLALKVEGVIRHDGAAEFKKIDYCSAGTKKGMVFRTVEKVKVSVTSTSLQQSNNITKGLESGVTMINFVQPHNNYFSTQFLICFPVLGNHNVVVEAFVVDCSGMCWKFGSKETLLARSFDDSLKSHKTSHHHSGSNCKSGY